MNIATKVLLLGGVMLSLGCGLSGRDAARAEGWSAALTPVPPRHAAAPAKRKSAKTPAKIRTEKPAPKPAPPAASPALAAPPLEATADAVSAAPAPAAAADTAAPAAAEPALPPVDSAADIPAAPDAGRQDLFSDLRLLQRPVEGEVLTTQVVPSEPSRTVPAPPEGAAAQQYCTNIADAALEARLAWQRLGLAEAERELQQRTAELEAKTAEFQKWLARRDEFSRKAQQSVIDIYAKMRPDAAALQLQALDDETAAAVLTKLDARIASAVMNEMDPVAAARLTAIISGAARVPPARPRPPAGNRS
jgi:flagellar motility protein MotE (MotC chaperone)